MTERNFLPRVAECMTEADRVLDRLLPHMKLLGTEVLSPVPDGAMQHYEVVPPTEEFAFLHEAAVIHYHGALFAAWYNCPERELKDRSPIRFRRSTDGGKTWGEIKTVADDLSGGILYCPPVFGVDGGRLYMLLNQMVSADHMHSLDLYIYNEDADAFEPLWSRPLPFKLNTNVCPLDSGRLLLPGRIAELDQFPNTPAVIISDSGRIDAHWRLVKLQENGDLPDGSAFVHPELTTIIHGEAIHALVRDDERCVPLLYRSGNGGETWEGPVAHDIPLSSSKIYSGRLSDGRSYIIGNLFPFGKRDRLALFLSDGDSLSFTRAYLLQDGPSGQLGFGEAWHYPCAWEADGKLYVIYTVNHGPSWRRGAVLTVIDLSKI